MADLIRYDLLVQDALRGVVRQVLTDVARNGLQGDHHFFITFKTKTPGLRLSNRMRERYPDEMTIILQHQFWGLTVQESGFEVGLSFNNAPERLLVPFAAITMFQDPSVTFGLKFDVHDETPGSADSGAEPPKALPGKRALAPVEGVKVLPQATGTKGLGSKGKADKSSSLDKTAAPEKVRPVLTKVSDNSDDAEVGGKGEPKVVSIDSFRKKP